MLFFRLSTKSFVLDTQEESSREIENIRRKISEQYQKLLELDGVELEFDKEALEKIADTSLARKTGARGLRAIMENVMMDTMYHVPSNDRIKTCRITKEAVEGTADPVYNSETLTSESA